jgi:small-conductance mechanosensitive channel/CRP-like cAMP-binding protein
MDVLLEKLRQILTAQILDITGTKFSIASIAILLGLIILTLFMSKLISETVRLSLLIKLRVNRGPQEAITASIKYSLATISSIIILQTAGINLSSLAVIAGVVGIGVGFGLQNLATNFISGVVLLFEQTLKVGDYIEIGKLKGTIEKISIRSTIVRTNDDVFVVVPNHRLIENDTLNWSYKDHTCRIHIPISVAYDTDLLLLTESLLTAARHEPRVLSTPTPEVQLINLEGSYNLELLVWIDSASDNSPIRSSLNFRIAYAIKEKGIKMAITARELSFSDPEVSKSIHHLFDLELQQKPKKNETLTSSNSDISISINTNSQNLRDLLRQTSYFERCTEVELFALISSGYRKHFGMNEIICKENEPGEEFYIILSGSVEISSERNKQAITTLGQGDFFGEISLLTGTPRIASVRSETFDTVLFIVERQQLAKLLSKYKELGEQIALKLAERKQILISLGLLNEEELQKSQYTALSWVRNRLNAIFGINLA